MYLQQTDPHVRKQVLSAPKMLFAALRLGQIQTMLTAHSFRVPLIIWEQDIKVDEVHIPPALAQEYGHLEILQCHVSDELQVWQ